MEIGKTPVERLQGIITALTAKSAAAQGEVSQLDEQRRELSFQVEAGGGNGATAKLTKLDDTRTVGSTAA